MKRKIIHYITKILVLLTLSNALYSGEIDYIRENIEKIYSFGPRNIYTDGREKTKNFIKKELEKYGYNIREYDYQYQIGQRIVKIYNIFGYTGTKKDLIIIVSHYDSKYNKDSKIMGVNDNLSGVVANLEIARILKEKKLLDNIEEDIGFLFTDIEESIFKWSETDGIYGSRAQVKIWEQEGLLSRIKYIIVLDMIGDSNTSFCKDTASDKELTDKIWKIAKKKGYNFFSQCSSSIPGDHIPFIKKGIKSTIIIPYPLPFYLHKKEDEIDKIDYSFILKTVDLIIDFLLSKDR